MSYGGSTALLTLCTEQLGVAEASWFLADEPGDICECSGEGMEDFQGGRSSPSIM